VRWPTPAHRHPRHAILFAATAGLLLGPLSQPLSVLAAVALAAALALPLPPRALPLLAAGALLLGAVVADLRLTALEGGRLPGLHGRSIAARAVMLEPVRVRPGGLATARARLLDGPAPGEGAVLRIRGPAHPGAWPGVGEIVALAGAVEPLGRFDAYQRRRGALVAVEVSRLRVTGERRRGLAGVVDSARRRAETGLARGLEPPEAALLRGMVLGQDEQLSDDVRTDFKRSGLAHVLAVSGQNVMLLATLVLGAGAAVGAGLRARLLLALALVALYVPLTGAGPSIQRAGVMGAAGLVAALAGRPAHRWYALGLAAAVTLTLNPRAAGEPGWQLSFAAVVALLALAPPLRGWLARTLPGPVADIAAMTVAATIGTAPLMAMHFGQVSLAALPANLLAAAAIAPVMWLGMLAAGAAQIAPELAAPFAVVNAPLLGFVEWVARTMAGAPAAVLPLRLGSPAALGLAYAALAGAVTAARLVGRRLPSRGVRLPRHRAQPTRARLAAAVAVAGAIVVLLAAATSARDAPVLVDGEVVVSFLDVGQGDATLIQSGQANVLVDTGPPGGPILQRLREAGVRRLDGLVLTHAQTDHEGMALEVMRAYPTRLVVDGGAGWPTYVQRGLPAAIAARRARRLDAHAGQVISFGAITIRVLWPPAPGPSFRPEGDPNDRAIVALVRVGDFDLFLPADAESNVTAPLSLPRVEALKVAHHGSDDAGLPALLERLQPAVAAIEVGRGNTYGHPTPSTLTALRAVDEVFRTDRDGTVRLRVHAGAMRVERSP
jgi:competence protein ComEC